MTKNTSFLSKSLLVISHTEHFLGEDGLAYGWTPTVREIDFLAQHFNRIIHLAVLNPGLPPESTSAYQAKNVKFISIPPFGGKGIKGKLSIFWVMPLVLWKIAKILPKIDIFQFRAPTSIGLAIIPFLTLFSGKKGWYKYAGNWVQPNMPKSYKLQKWMLEKWQKRPVTINGRWQNQPTHVFSFENPCLSDAELIQFNAQGELRTWSKPFTGCFVGRLDDAKGVHRIVNLLLKPGIEQMLSTFHFIGSGAKREAYEKELAGVKLTVTFHGFCSREETFAIYAQSHFILLPSDSEGFPKVIAEAAAFGCIPFVSDVSSIGQYINERNGFLWPMHQVAFKDFVATADLDELPTKSQNIVKLAERFTFEAYWEKIGSLILPH